MPENDLTEFFAPMLMLARKNTTELSPHGSILFIEKNYFRSNLFSVVEMPKAILQ